jgi:cation diffusion facilitator family transporter
MTVPHQKDSPKAESNEKIKIAMSSIAASVTLTIVKLVVGSYTNSLGILSEAMHSGLDIIATVMTYQAVRMALRPPDTRYTYGYAKFESIASLVEIILLFAVAAWVFNEGIDRIFFKSVEPEITVFSFAIMFISIAVDFGRSRVLYKAARKY